MAERTLAVEVRTEAGKGPARRLRARGKIPAVVYGHQATRLVAIDEHEFNQKFGNIPESTIITLQMPGETVDVLVKDYQEDLTKERITHLDFFEIERGKLLRTHVHLHLEGSPIGVREGGLLETLTHSLEIECLPRNLPERISVDISGLVIGQSVHVRDVTPPEGVTIRTPVDQTVCLVTVHKVVEEKPAVTEEEEAALAAAEAEPQETEEQA